MHRIQSFITSLPFIAGGLFFSLYSKRLTRALIKSTMFLSDEFHRKREFSRNSEVVIQIFVILFGLMLILVGIRLFIEIFK